MNARDVVGRVLQQIVLQTLGVVHTSTVQPHHGSRIVVGEDLVANWTFVLFVIRECSGSRLDERIVCSHKASNVTLIEFVVNAVIAEMAAVSKAIIFSRFTFRIRE